MFFESIVLLFIAVGGFLTGIIRATKTEFLDDKTNAYVDSSLMYGQDSESYKGQAIALIVLDFINILVVISAVLIVLLTRCGAIYGYLRTAAAIFIICIFFSFALAAWNIANWFIKKDKILLNSEWKKFCLALGILDFLLGVVLFTASVLRCTSQPEGRRIFYRRRPRTEPVYVY